MAYVTMEDMTGSMELVVFPKILENSRALLQEDTAVAVRGRVNIRDEEANVIVVDELLPLEQAGRGPRPAAAVRQEEKTVRRGLYLRCNLERDKNAILSALCRFPGDMPVVLASGGKALRAPKGFDVRPEQQLIETLEKLLGAENVKLIR